MKDPSESNYQLPITDYSEHGFSLIEVMLALAVLAIAMPVLLGLRNSDVVMRDQARMLTMATLLAQHKLSETELGTVPPVGEQAGDFSTIPAGVRAAVPADQARSFQWRRTVAATPFEAVREVRVRVSWPRGAQVDGMPHRDGIELTQYIFETK